MSDLGGDPPCWAHTAEDARDCGLPEGALIADLGSVTTKGGGAIWSLPHGGDLDANLVRLEPGACIGDHVNDDVDVLLFVQAGSGRVQIDGSDHALRPEHLVLVPRDASRSITAGPTGITYLSVHRRRRPLGIISEGETAT